ncbi:MAG: 4-hydroxy-3-methylbut-2-enyl diphosphate reductase [Lachnospiraceae bacterium]|nr:4-hydroxy-3-methylbut-2-enyl diphosphate reductase [Lachnospiraceae bacterium]
MENVKVAKTAGFCFGVQRAVDMVYEAADRESVPVYTWGPIIHNEIVVKDMESKGVSVLKEHEGALPTEGCVIVRSHGVTEETYNSLKASGLKVVDATCPFVKKIHRIVEQETLKGRHVIIVGNRAHPEVIGIRGWAKGPCDVVATLEDFKALNLPKDAPLTIVAQTTFNFDYFQELVEIACFLGYDVEVTNTICNATRERQREAADLAGRVDVMLVVGSKESSNTQKLYDICKGKCSNTYYIEKPEDLVTVQISPGSCVGITAGASAPHNIIQEVSDYVRIKF